MKASSQGPKMPVSGPETPSSIPSRPQSQSPLPSRQASTSSATNSLLSIKRTIHNVCSHSLAPAHSPKVFSKLRPPSLPGMRPVHRNRIRHGHSPSLSPRLLPRRLQRHRTRRSLQHRRPRSHESNDLPHPRSRGVGRHGQRAGASSQR